MTAKEVLARVAVIRADQYRRARELYDMTVGDEKKNWIDLDDLQNLEIVWLEAQLDVIREDEGKKP